VIFWLRAWSLENLLRPGSQPASKFRSSNLMIMRFWVWSSPTKHPFIHEVLNLMNPRNVICLTIKSRVWGGWVARLLCRRGVRLRAASACNRPVVLPGVFPVLGVSQLANNPPGGRSVRRTRQVLWGTGISSVRGAVGYCRRRPPGRHCCHHRFYGRC